MCTSRRRQRPTARRLHHAWWFRRSRPASCATSATGGVSPLPRPEDHSNRQATRTSRRARALLREDRLAGALGLASSSSPARRELPTGRPAGWPPARPPASGRWTARTVDGAAPPRVGAQQRNADLIQGESGTPSSLRGDRRIRSREPSAAPASNSGRPCPQIVASTTSRPRPLRKAPTVPQHPRSRARRRARAHSASSTGKKTTREPADSEQAVCSAAARRQHTGCTPPAHGQHATCTQAARHLHRC
jgi:hypothetical protein